MNDKGNIIIYQTKDGQTLIDVRLENETVWINRQQMAELFDRDVKTIGKHITNALKEELKEIPTVAKFATVQKEGKREITRNLEYYNLDVIISVGYRVNTKRGIQFRQWANSQAHDRFLIIDQSDIYHIGASLKDLGKKLFAFSKMDIPASILTKLL